MAEVTTQGKFRGPEFSPFSFKLVSTTSEKLVDTKGRRIWTVFAEPLTDQERAVIEREGHSAQDAVLRVLLDWPEASLSEMAGRLFWITPDGKPHKSKVHRLLQGLAKLKLVEQKRDGTYTLTKKGREEAEKPRRSGPLEDDRGGAFQRSTPRKGLERNGWNRLLRVVGVPGGVPRWNGKKLRRRKHLTAERSKAFQSWNGLGCRKENLQPFQKWNAFWNAPKSVVNVGFKYRRLHRT